MGWISPTSNVANGWADPTLAYNANTADYASYLVVKGSWSPYLELYISSISCDKVQIWSSGQTTDINQIAVDIEYNSTWNNIYSGALIQGSYQEYIIGSTQDVTGMRIRYYNSKSNATRYAYCHEVQLWEIVSGPTPNAYNKILYTSEPPTPNAWNQVKQDAGMGWKKLLYV